MFGKKIQNIGTKTNKDFFNLQKPTIKDRSSEFNKYHYVTRHMSINL